ncbi:hypothetical protein Bca4012_052772 [Brassica carinata]
MEKVLLKSDVLDSIKSDGKVWLENVVPYLCISVCWFILIEGRWSMQEDGLIRYGSFHGEVNQENSGFRNTEAVQRICVGDKAWIILQKQPVSTNNPGDHALGVSPLSLLSPGAQRFLSLIVVIFVLCEKVLTLSMAKSKITRDVPFNESKAPRLKDFGNKKGKGHCI